MPTVYLGIGSNLGDRGKNCFRAIELLEEYKVRVILRSSMHETEPWGVKDQPEFINMALKAETDKSPRELLSAIKEIENRMGRVEAERYGPRVIDLDILMYDDLIINEPDLIIPHPHMHERAFILKPLAEIAPDAVHPVMWKYIKDLYAALQS